MRISMALRSLVVTVFALGGAAAAAQAAQAQAPDGQATEGKASEGQAAQQPVSVPCNDVDRLRTAIVDANNGTGSGVINLASTCTYTIDEPDASGSAFPAIRSSVTLRGSDTQIERAGKTARFKIIEVAQTGSLTLDEITIRNGSAGYGAGIVNDGVLRLENSQVLDDSEFFGGGIVNNGVMSIRSTTVNGNGMSASEIGSLLSAWAHLLR